MRSLCNSGNLILALLAKTTKNEKGNKELTMPEDKGQVENYGVAYIYVGKNRDRVRFKAWEPANNKHGGKSRSRINIQLLDGTWRNVPRSSVMEWPE
jgi:hypothetical protein